MPDRELFTGLDVYVDALNAINASQGWARRINDDVRKENIHGEFRFPSATSADVALAKRVPIIAKSALLPPKSPGPQECPGTLWNVPGTLEEYSCGPYLPTDQSEFDWEVKLGFC